MDKTEAILLFVISVGAFVVPFLSKRLNLPSSVGEMLYGLFLGIFFKEIVENTPIVKFLGELGFIILMYLAGLEIDFEKFKKTPKITLVFYLLNIFSIISLSFGTVFYFKQPVAYALVYLATAVGLLFSVLRDTKILKTHFAQSILIIGSIGEIASLLIITIMFLYFKFGIGEEAVIHFLEIAAFFTIAYFSLKLFQLYIWWNPHLMKHFLTTGDSSETGVRANLANMFIFVALASLFGLEPIIGAFFGGILFAMIFKRREEVIEKISAFGYGFLIPIFFIEVGLRFDIFQILQTEIIKKALIFSLSIFFIRFVSSLFLLFANFSLKEVFLSAFSLSIPLTLLAAIATLGLEINMITEDDASAIVLTAILTGLFYPWCFKMLVKYTDKNIKDEKDVQVNH
ncbi:MAG: cation:proton antiporter [Aquificota bacterium]|nr:MAG: cation:proton antiporter [Aquificota bacterium]